MWRKWHTESLLVSESREVEDEAQGVVCAAVSCGVFCGQKGRLFLLLGSLFRICLSMHCTLGVFILICSIG